MAEFDPIPPRDDAEVAYAQALLGDEAGREHRRARLMAALPRPEAAAATPVARTELAWRWWPYAWGLLAMGLLLATLLVLRGRPADLGQKIDPRLAAAPAASKPVVVAQAEPATAPAAPLPPVELPRAAAKVTATAKPLVAPPPMVVADASEPQLRREVQAAPPAAVELLKPALEPPPAAPVMAAAPVRPAPAPVVMAAAPAPPPAAPATVAPAAAPVAPPSQSNQSEALARIDVAAGLASTRSRSSLAASDAVPAKLMAPADATLLAAVNRSDPSAARSALQAGASVHLRDARGRSLLMLAARSGSREMVELLLTAGASRDDRDLQGWTAADHARDGHHDELSERLR